MYKIALLVGTGGFIGSIARLLMQQLVSRHATTIFPLGTFIVNILGCFVIGLVYGAANKSSWMSAEWRFFIGTGLCGGFTTFSTFSYENLTLLKEGNYTYCALYMISSLLLGLLASLIGVVVINSLYKI